MTATKKKRPNKQRTSRGASFKRIAAELKVLIQNDPPQTLTHALRHVITAHQGEADRLRAMP